MVYELEVDLDVPHYIYIVSAPNGYVKIGHGAEPFARYSSFRAASTLPLTMEYVCECPDAAYLEGVLHEALKAFRRHGEWFEFDASRAVEAARYALTVKGYALRLINERPRKYPSSRPIYQSKLMECAVRV